MSNSSRSRLFDNSGPHREEFLAHSDLGVKYGWTVENQFRDATGARSYLYSGNLSAGVFAQRARRASNATVSMPPGTFTVTVFPADGH